MPEQKRNRYLTKSEAIDRAIHMVVRRSGRTTEDPVVEVTSEMLKRHCNTSTSVDTSSKRAIRLIMFFDDRGVDLLDATQPDVEAFIGAFEGKSMQSQAAASKISKAWIDTAFDTGKIAVYPLRNMAKIKGETVNHAPALSKVQVESVLNDITKDFGHPDRDLRARRDHALINVMVHTAVRAFEIAAVERDDIQATGEFVRMHFMGKSRKPAKMKLAEPLHAEVERFWEAFETETGIPLPGHGPAFMSLGLHARKVARDSGTVGATMFLYPAAVNDICKARFAAVKIKQHGAGAHSLRATAAVLAYRAGADLLEIQQLLRHKSLETTRIYLTEVIAEAQDAAVDSIKLDLL